MNAERPEAEGISGRAARRVADHDRGSELLRDALEPRREVDGGPEDREVDEGVRSQVPDHDRPRVHADTDAKAAVAAAAEIDGAGSLDERRGAADRLTGRVVRRLGDAERGHHAVAEELVHHAPVLEDDAGGDVEPPAQDLEHLLGLALVAVGREASHVAEEHGGGSAAWPGGALGERGSDVGREVAREAQAALLLGEGRVAHADLLYGTRDEGRQGAEQLELRVAAGRARDAQQAARLPASDAHREPVALVSTPGVRIGPELVDRERGGPRDDASANHRAPRSGRGEDRPELGFGREQGPRRAAEGAGGGPLPCREDRLDVGAFGDGTGRIVERPEHEPREDSNVDVRMNPERGIDPPAMGLRIRSMSRSALCLVALLCLAFLSAPARVRAHGETARGGGSANALNAMGGLVGPGWGFGLRLELRQFDVFTDEQLSDFVLAGEDVHQHSQEISAFANANVTLLPDLDVSFVLPFNAFLNFREAELDAARNTRIVADDVSAGLGDLVAVGRYRIVREGSNHLALVAGVKLPTGMNRETDNEGERLGAHNQPGSGSIDFQLGAAYTFAEGDFGLTADVIAHIRTEGVLGYQAGNMLQADLAVSYRLGPVALVAELNYLVSENDVEYDEILANTGIHTLYASPGVVLTIERQHALYATASIPIVQALPGIQNNELVRASVGYSVSFGASPPEPDTDPGDGHGHQHRHGHTHTHEGGAPHHHAPIDSEPDGPPSSPTAAPASDPDDLSTTAGVRVEPRDDARESDGAGPAAGEEAVDTDGSRADD